MSALILTSKNRWLVIGYRSYYYQLLDFFHTNALLATRNGLVDYLAIHSSEDGVILAEADVAARANAGASLAHQDTAGAHGLAGVHLHAEALGMTVSSVAAGAATFFMCHGSSLVYFFFGFFLSAAGFFAAGFLALAAGFLALVAGFLPAAADFLAADFLAAAAGLAAVAGLRRAVASALSTLASPWGASGAALGLFGE